ncbi:acetylornithine transaminase, partial [Myxococcota bacterium]|nr:acetylornithine transaminase [Myxococcota bacterium]
MKDIQAESNAALVEEAQHLFVPNYKPAPFVIAKGEGVWLFDVEGHRYLDLVGGIAVSALGHGHPKLVAAVAEQAARVMHTSNLYLNRPSIELARRILDVSFGDRIFFCNSGAEANEAQLKLARRVAWDRGEKTRTKIITFTSSFHGRTLGALAATAQPKYQEGFGPMPAGFVYLPYGDVAALEAAIDRDTAAVLVEPVQGEGGVRVAPEGFLAKCRELCDRSGAMLMFDEVQIGVGRSGKYWGYEHDGVVPDVMSIAKGIAGGLPLGAIVTTERFARHLAYGTHGTTFGGNPVSCAAGAVIFDALAEPGFLAHVSSVGQVLRDGLVALGEKHRVFTEVR